MMYTPEPSCGKIRDAGQTHTVDVPHRLHKSGYSMDWGG